MVTYATYEDLLATLAERDDRIVVVTAENRAAIRNLPPRLGDRFIDVGICEQTMVGAAAGLALRGRIPICHALATFLTLRAFEFIRTDVGIARLPVKLVGAVPGFLSDGNGPTHQAIEDISLMRGIPHMQIVCPADEEELLAAMPAVIASPDPCYVRFNATRPTVEHVVPFEMGQAEVLSEGNDVSLLTYGLMLREANVARQRLESHGVRVRLVNVRTLRPFDSRATLRAAAESKLVVTIEDHFKIGGLYSIVCELLVESGVRARVLPIALDARWFKPGLLPDVLTYEGFDGASIAARVLEALRS
ncbi:MAG: transketolase C-terminal domain-containing protein [Polyangiaceae bacterium]|jgi:transketolase